jgi:hypothetical protein
MQVDDASKNNNNKLKQNRRLCGCPTCHRSRYVVLTSTIKDKRYHYRELYCHLCNITITYIHAVTPVELKEHCNNAKM